MVVKLSMLGDICNIRFVWMMDGCIGMLLRMFIMYVFVGSIGDCVLLIMLRIVV